MSLRVFKHLFMDDTAQAINRTTEIYRSDRNK
jgi:hypothetical protein